MKKNIFTVLLLSAVIVAPMSAKKVTKEYQRPSLHMVLLNTDEPTSDKITPEVMKAVNESWTDYEFPSVYNQFTIPFASMNAGKPKGSMMDLITKYQDPKSFEKLTKDQLVEIGQLFAGKQYNADLKARVDSIAPEVAKQLVMKWFNITPDGKYDINTIAQLACYSASQASANEAIEEANGATISLIQALMEPTIANSYVTFSKVNFYSNEPIAAFVRNLAVAVAALAGNDMVTMAATTAADGIYKLTKDGYSAYTTTLLYRLKWNDAIYQELAATMTENQENSWEGTINMEAFNKIHFELEYIGVDKCNTVVMMNKDNKGASEELLARQTVHKNINKQLVRLQNSYEEFKPMMPILEVDKKYILADMGTKEGVAEGETFNIIAGETNAKGITKYRVIGAVKVLKGCVWDNQDVDAAAAADAAAFSGEEAVLQGTKLKGFKGAEVGMFVKRQKANK